jgi:NAD-dependent SIR2 family protein deacetylase
MLKCSFCQKLKSKTEFYKDHSQPSGYMQRCKSCKKIIINLKKRITLFNIY